MHATRYAVLAATIVGLAAGCSAGATGRLAGALGARPANSGLPADVAECLPLKDPRAGVAAYASDGERLPFDVLAGHEPGTDPRCGPGELRLLRLATLRIDGQPTYVRRGGCETPCRVREATVHVPASAFAAPLDLLPSAAREGDGARVAGCRSLVRDAPQRAGRRLEEMFYKRGDERSTSPEVGARWSNYGDPGALYHSPAAHPADYAYLLWNLPRTPSGVLHGGGIVEAVIARAQPVLLCPVAALELPAFDSAGRADGDVEFGYAELRLGSQAIYGWVMLAYTYRGHRTQTTTGP
jgi:hypothetical protein